MFSLTSRVITNRLPPFPHCAVETDWEKTSLKPYVALLDAHNKALMDETRRRKRGDKNVEISTSEHPSAMSFVCCFVGQSLTRDTPSPRLVMLYPTSYTQGIVVVPLAPICVFRVLYFRWFIYRSFNKQSGKQLCLQPLIDST